MIDVQTIRQDFPMLKNNPDLIYFDNGATTLKPQCVIDAVTSFYTHHTSNVHRGDYAIAAKNDALYDGARCSFAKLLNCSPKEIVFTHNASASMNQIAYGLAHGFLKKGDVILTTEAEHASDLLPWYRLQEEFGIEIRYLPMDNQANVDLEAAKKCFTPEVKAVAAALVTNVLGSILPAKELAEMAHENGAIFIADGAQAVPHMHIDVRDIGIDLMAFSAHKMCGPSGMGVMYGKSELLKETEPLCLGGGSNARFFSCGDVILKESPYKFESGTQNIEGIMGMGAAASYLMDIGFDNIAAHERELRDYLVSQLEKLDNVILYNPKGDSGIVTFNVKGIFSQDAAGYLASQGIAVRSGNHCAKILVDFLKTDDTIRSSLYFYNTKEDVDALVEAVRTCTIENCIGIFF